MTSHILFRTDLHKIISLAQDRETKNRILSSGTSPNRQYKRVLPLLTGRPNVINFWALEGVTPKLC